MAIDSARRRTRPQSIDEALRVLDEALITEPDPAPNGLLSDEAIRREFSDWYPSGAPAEPNLLPNLLKERIEYGRSVAKIAATQLDRGMPDNPWPVISGIAVGALALGYLLGRNSRLKSEE